MLLLLSFSLSLLLFFCSHKVSCLWPALMCFCMWFIFYLTLFLALIIVSIKHFTVHGSIQLDNTSSLPIHLSLSLSPSLVQSVRNSPVPQHAGHLQTILATKKAPPFQHIWKSGRVERHIPTTRFGFICITGLTKSYTLVSKEDCNYNSSTWLQTAVFLKLPQCWVNTTPISESNFTLSIFTDWQHLLTAGM